MSAVKSGVKKIWHTLQGHGGGGDASRSTREEEQQASATGGGKSGGISFGAAEVVDDDGDGEEGLVEAGESFSLKPNGGESPSAQPKKPGRVTMSLPEEDKPKKVKRSKTQGTPGSVGTGCRRCGGRKWGEMSLRMCAICTGMAGMVCTCGRYVTRGKSCCSNCCTVWCVTIQRVTFGTHNPATLGCLELCQLYLPLLLICAAHP